MGSADSTTMVVSLFRKNSSMKWVMEKQARGSGSPHFTWGNIWPQNGWSLVAGLRSYSSRWPWTSRTNSWPPMACSAASGSVVASVGMT